MGAAGFTNTKLLDREPKNQHFAFEKNLINSRATLLFKTNELGILSGINDPADSLNSGFPLLYICSDTLYSIIAVKAGSAENWVLELKRLITEKTSDAEFKFEHVAGLINGAAARLGRNLKIEIAHAYYISQAERLSVNVMEINQANKHLIAKDFPNTYTHLADCSLCLIKTIDDQIVSICRTVRKSRFAMECGVETLAEFEKMATGHWSWRLGRLKF